MATLVFDEPLGGSNLVFDEPAAPSPPPKKSLLTKALDLPLVRQVNALAETGTQMATGTAGQAVGGIRGLVDLATGGTLDSAVNKIKSTEEAMTYQPRTQAGKDVSAAMMYPIEKGSEGLGWVGEKVGGEAGRAIGEVALPITMTLAGGRGALRKAREAQGNAKPSGPTAEEIDFARQNAERLDAGDIARSRGIVYNPADTNQSLPTRLLTSIAGRDNINTTASRMNEGKWGNIVREDLGISRDAPLDIDTLKTVRDASAKSGERIAQLGTMGADEATLSSIERLRQEPTIGGQQSAGHINALVNDALDQLRQGMDAGEVLRNISQLRKDSRDIYKMSDAGPEKLAIADTNLKIANSLEGMIDTNLYGMNERNPYLGLDTLMNEYKADRTRMAKSYTLEEVLDQNQGKIDPALLAKLGKRDNALTGGFADIAKIAGNFPDVIKLNAHLPPVMEGHVYRSTLPSAIGAGIGASFGDMAGAGAGGVAGYYAGQAASALTKNAVLSKSGQGRFGTNKVPTDLRRPYDADLADRLVDQLRQRPDISREFNVPPEGGNTLPPPIPPTGPFRGNVPEGEGMVRSNRPNWTRGTDPDPQFGVTPEPRGPNALPEFSGEETMNVVRRQRGQEYDAAKRADQAAQTKAEVEAAALRKSASGGQVIGDKEPSGSSLPKPTTLESATQKMVEGRAFDMTHEERLAWKHASKSTIEALRRNKEQ